MDPVMDTMMLKHELEALLMAADMPLPLERLCKLLENEAGLGPGRDSVRAALAELTGDYAARGVELSEGAGGYRFRTRAAYAERVSRLWEERKPRYSRALLETLALIAYRQPITRGEIEHVRGVAVSSNIMRLLLEREWVRVVGHRDVPGRPAVYATTREFLDYFGLRSLAELPSLAELKDFDAVNADLFANVVLDAAALDVADTASQVMTVGEAGTAPIARASSESDHAQVAS
jgi:segregation and condensation protein B